MNSCKGIGTKEKSSLGIFLMGTLCESNPLRKFRGQCDILRYIWLFACEEWWDLHIERFGDSIPMLYQWNKRVVEDYTSQYPAERQQLAGCPVAILERDVYFPPPLSGPIDEIGTDYLYVNMMPIVLRDAGSVPLCCAGYLPLIDICKRRMQQGWRQSLPDDLIVYLTIDERPTPPSESQRRGGLHVESPGMLPVIHSVEDLKYSYAGNFVPGAEHHWGNGMMMRDESFQGGIYMASTVADTCAVWNCCINDCKGDIIGIHGNIERLRPLLGPATATLRANELVWMTDRTPHESLPLPPGAVGTRRQYFRLVVGEVTAWFADHSTPNPLGIMPPSCVRVVTGNKFDIGRITNGTEKWLCGNDSELRAAKNMKELREILHVFGLGHSADLVVNKAGVKNLDDLRKLRNEDVRRLWDDFGAHYYDCPQMCKLIAMLKEGTDLIF